MAAGVNQGLLIRKGLLLAKVETVAGQDALPVASLDAIQAFDAEFSVDPNILERQILTGDISPVEHIIGRKLSSISFSVEMKSNGLFNGDVVTDEPRLARLLRGCGYALSGRPDKATSFTTDFATDNDLTMPAAIGADHGLQTADQVQVYVNGGTLPTGLVAATDYWVIRKLGTTFALAATKSDAIAGTEITLTGDAVGTVQVDLITSALVNPDPSNDASLPVTRINRHKGVGAGETLTFTGQPADTETVTIDTKVYICQTVLTNVDGNVLIGATPSDSLDNLIAAITLASGAGTLYATATTLHPTATAGRGAGDTMVARAKAIGTNGNSIATTETLAANGSWGAATMSGGTGPTDNIFTEPVLYTVEVTTGGVSGEAQVLISGNNDTQDDTSGNTPFFVIHDAPFELAGATGSDVSVSFQFLGANLVVGDKWRVLVHSDGIVASPVSENFDCLTLKFFEDGLLYTVLGSQGTFTVDATAGSFATFEFTFTGQFVPVADVATPASPVFETTLPQQVELGLLTWGSNVQLVAEQWTFDQANNVVPRPDVNASDGFRGVRITDRTPAGGFNPEATFVATEDFWGDFSNALAKVFTARVGTSQGNQVVLYSPRVQTSEIAFGDRDGVRSFDHSMLFKRLNGNDESDWYFT